MAVKGRADADLSKSDGSAEGSFAKFFLFEKPKLAPCGLIRCSVFFGYFGNGYFSVFLYGFGNFQPAFFHKHKNHLRIKVVSVPMTILCHKNGNKSTKTVNGIAYIFRKS